MSVGSLTSGLTLSVPRYEEVQGRMRPGKWSEAGFLGKNEDLRTVTLEDSKTLESLGITPAQIASKIREIFNSAAALKATAPEAFKNRTFISDGYEIKWQVWLGAQACPFSEIEYNPYSPFTLRGHCGETQTDWTVRDLATQESIAFSGLMPHLIEDHQFFEGNETSYRLDPELACRVLRLKPQ